MDRPRWITPEAVEPAFRQGPLESYGKLKTPPLVFIPRRRHGAVELTRKTGVSPWRR
jgi:hypothetical protein